jgi:hypothetical protein
MVWAAAAATAGLQDAIVYLCELAATGCVRAEQFTVVAHGCRGSEGEAEVLQLLRDLLHRCNSTEAAAGQVQGQGQQHAQIEVDPVLREALRSNGDRA